MTTHPKKYYRLFASLIFITILSLLGCQEPIDLNFPTEDAKLVVDGFITDLEKEHMIRLSYSSGFNEDGVNVPDKIRNALVTIMDDSGNGVTLTHRTLGEYYTPLFKPDNEKAYKVVVQIEGETFESTSQSFPSHREETKIRYEPTQKQLISGSGQIQEQIGMGIYVDLDRVDEPVYYQWLQRNYSIWEAINAPENLTLYPNRFCYVRNFDRIQVDVYRASFNNQSNTIELELDFLPTSATQFHDFSIQVTQLITSKESFEYWNKVKNVSENMGSVFDAAPYSLRGNIESSTGEAALGFFGVYNESSDRLFYKNCEIEYELRAQLFSSCPLLMTYEDKVAHPCWNCLTAYGISSQLEAPDWWRPVPEFYSDEWKCDPYNN